MRATRRVSELRWNRFQAIEKNRRAELLFGFDKLSRRKVRHPQETKEIFMIQNRAIQQAAVALNPVQQARRGLALYFAILVPITARLEGIMIARGEFVPWVLLARTWRADVASPQSVV